MNHPCLSPWKGAVAGGLIAFAWNSFSWMVLPFHAMTLGPLGSLAPFGGSMGLAMLGGLLLQGFGGFWWTWILGKIPGLTTADAAKYGAMFGLCVGVLGALPNSVSVSWGFSLLPVLDAVIAWTIASPVIARWCQASVCALPKR